MRVKRYQDSGGLGAEALLNELARHVIKRTAVARRSLPLDDPRRASKQAARPKLTLSLKRAPVPPPPPQQSLPSGAAPEIGRASGSHATASAVPSNNKLKLSLLPRGTPATTTTTTNTTAPDPTSLSSQPISNDDLPCMRGELAIDEASNTTTIRGQWAMRPADFHGSATSELTSPFEYTLAASSTTTQSAAAAAQADSSPATVAPLPLGPYSGWFALKGAGSKRSSKVREEGLHFACTPLSSHAYNGSNNRTMAMALSASGVNAFGPFAVKGTATPVLGVSNRFSIELFRRYLPAGSDIGAPVTTEAPTAAPAPSAPPKSSSKITFKIRLGPPAPKGSDAAPAPAAAHHMPAQASSEGTSEAADDSSPSNALSSTSSAQSAPSAVSPLSAPAPVAAARSQDDVECCVMGCVVVDRHQKRLPYWRRAVGGSLPVAESQDLPEEWTLKATSSQHDASDHQQHAQIPTHEAPFTRGYFPLCTAHAQEHLEWRRAQGAPPRFSQHLPRLAAASAAAAAAAAAESFPDNGHASSEAGGPAAKRMKSGPSANAPARTTTKAPAKKIDLRTFLKKNKARR